MADFDLLFLFNFILSLDAEAEGKTVAYESIGMDVESARGTAQKCKSIFLRKILNNKQIQ